MSRKMPRQKPGRSKQTYRTPPEFYAAVCRKFGTPRFDLAATRDNTLCADFFGPEHNSLSLPWPTSCLCWLNPPFADIGPWVKRAAQEALAELLVLLPASVGSEWFAKYVFGAADVYFLRPRLSFDGKHPYPKDLMLAHYDPKATYRALRLWPWKIPPERTPERSEGRSPEDPQPAPEVRQYMLPFSGGTSGTILPV